jgi:hypothetical protein
MAHPADRFIKATDAPRGIVRACTLCRFSDLVLKPRPGTAGRGWGMREGNKQRGRLIAHIKTAHPEVLA